jgi:Glycoside hydrolase family 44
MRSRRRFLPLIAIAVLGCVSDGGGPGKDSGGVDPAAPRVVFTIDSTTNTHAISPYIYGTNESNLPAGTKGLTLTRVGGNRLSAYNWETNASNAGSDYQYSSDNYISSSATPGLPMKQAAQTASDAGASIILTVPMAGWVSADEKGACPKAPTAAQIAERFLPILPSKGSAFAYPPDLTDGKVYADEFVAYMESQFPSAQTDAVRRIFYMLDNEPDLWSSTHSEMHPSNVTYTEIVKSSVDFATGIKGAAPKALVFGPVNYGWSGMVNLQGAPDASGRDFLEFYLDAMKAAEASAGKRLLDVLDVHWYPEAKGDTRITLGGLTAANVEARLQAPRSLWDKTYTETSWIAQSSTSGPIYLIPRLQAKIDQHYPGTKLSISEYNYGASTDISGGIAQADVLGVYGREGLFAAAMWPMSTANTFLYAGFAMYRNYDGNGATFGDTSIAATTSASDKTSVYASVSSQDPTSIVVVAINKLTIAQAADIALTHGTQLTAADVYTLTSASATPTKGTVLAAVDTNIFNYTMPARSVSTLVFHP